MVAYPRTSSNAPDDSYNMIALPIMNLMTPTPWPQHQILTTNGNLYQKSKDRNHYLVTHYKSHMPAHLPCKRVVHQKPERKSNRKNQYAPYIEMNKQNIEANPQVYKIRQSNAGASLWNDKTAMGFYYIITKKGIKHATPMPGLCLLPKLAQTDQSH
jgi:hypothetical protein